MVTIFYYDRGGGFKLPMTIEIIYQSMSGGNRRRYSDRSKKFGKAVWKP